MQRNQTWAEDKNKFGYRMLQKMGWSEGKGLGKNEDGIKTHVRVKRRRTQSGIGAAVKKESDKWKLTGEVATGFSDVLARVSGGADVVDVSLTARKTDSTEEEVTSGKRSAQSYFRRRSRQKNVRAYSQEALREIFGGVVVPENNSDESSNSEEETCADTAIVPKETKTELQECQVLEKSEVELSESVVVPRTVKEEEMISDPTTQVKQPLKAEEATHSADDLKKEEEVLDVPASPSDKKERTTLINDGVAAGRVKKEKKNKLKKVKKVKKVKIKKNKLKKGKKKRCGAAAVLKSSSVLSVAAGN